MSEKGYILFGAEEYRGYSGVDGFLGMFSTIDAAKEHWEKHVNKFGLEWGHIAEIQGDQLVKLWDYVPIDIAPTTSAWCECDEFGKLPDLFVRVEATRKAAGLEVYIRNEQN